MTQTIIKYNNRTYKHQQVMTLINDICKDEHIVMQITTNPIGIHLFKIVLFFKSKPFGHLSQINRSGGSIFLTLARCIEDLNNIQQEELEG